MLNNSVTNSLGPVMLLAPMTHTWTHQCHRQGLQYELWLILKKWSTKSFENIMQNWMAYKNMQFRWNFAHSSKRTVSIDTLLVFLAVNFVSCLFHESSFWVSGFEVESARAHSRALLWNTLQSQTQLCTILTAPGVLWTFSARAGVIF